MARIAIILTVTTARRTIITAKMEAKTAAYDRPASGMVSGTQDDAGDILGTGDILDPGGIFDTGGILDVSGILDAGDDLDIGDSLDAVGILDVEIEANVPGTTRDEPAV